MSIVKWGLVALLAFGGLVAVMYLFQRKLMYFPETVRTQPSAVGLPAAEEITIDTADGEHLVAWHVPPRANNAVVIYFHGNAGSLRLRNERFQRITADGTGLVALSYRGYGGSSGRPTEKGLIDDALAAYAFAAVRYPASRLALWGESLGTGVAVALAAQKPVGRIVLESPFTSIADIAAHIYWFFPVRLLIKDSYRSDLLIRYVTAPGVDPARHRRPCGADYFWREAHALANEPKRLVLIPAAGTSISTASARKTSLRPFVAEAAR
jgi:pimeloyl-ACP methyl ester carboxylesterase